MRTFVWMAIAFFGLFAQADLSSSQYWTDIEKLCLEYSGATRPPCNRSNGAKMILDHVQQRCEQNKACLDRAVEICTQYAGATHAACNASNGLKTTLETIQSQEDMYPIKGAKIKVPKDAIDIHEGEQEVGGKKLKADQYWTDLEKLCREYSGATHPPCNRTNGAKMMLDHIEHNCKDLKGGDCLKRAVEICTQYSGATRPACHASNGLKTTLDVILSYEESQPKKGKDIVVPRNTIDIKKGEQGRAR